ncbi:MAG: hypothetical protein OEY87_06030 [Gammaproteobacteria bacterium]|nr:hypothetical protein [Gammaproteobacteria bacterium]MDH5735665.1 hypothetical protein [Gammaproteobacteria bacterium]
MSKSTLPYTALSLALLAPISANAAIIHLSGDTVDFFYDDASPEMIAYGSLYVLGDTIFATPSGFKAESTNGAGTDIFSASGTIQVTAKSGYSFQGINIVEGGTYTTTGNGSVDVQSALRVMEWGNLFKMDTQNLTISDLSATGTNPWQGTVNYDMTTAMWNDVNHVGLTLTNRLYATSPDLLSTASIDKTLAGASIGVEISTTVIPVPAAIWLFGSGFIALFGFARKRK